MILEVKRRYLGRKNIYTCSTCKAKTVTVDIDKGTTPFMIACLECEPGGMAQSQMYQVPQKLLPSQEFYKPDEKEYATLHADMREHVDRGGLLIRSIPKALTEAMVAARLFSEKLPPTMVAHARADPKTGKITIHPETV